VIVSLVDIGRIVDHLCLEVIVCFVDIGWIVDHHCLSSLFTIFKQSPPMELSQHNKQSPLNSDSQQFTNINKTNNHL
jgi:hypothetical protein